MDMKKHSALQLHYFFNKFKLFLISDILDAPVDKKIFLNLFEVNFNNSLFLFSGDGILIVFFKCLINS